MNKKPGPHKCPRGLKQFPIKPCAWAKIRMKGNPSEGCDWYVHDEKSKYCFWYYLYLHSNAQHSVTEISKLWNTSVNNVSIAERSAYSKIIPKLPK